MQPPAGGGYVDFSGVYDCLVIWGTILIKLNS
jgi:hypothetical protein